MGNSEIACPAKPKAAMTAIRKPENANTAYIVLLPLRAKYAKQVTPIDKFHSSDCENPRCR
jgi:hypothetical protein